MRYLSGVATLQLLQDRCTGCGMCAEVCPHQVLIMENGQARIADRDACMECGACARNCPVEAVTVQTGVGCAQAVINSALGRSGDGCCTLEDQGSPVVQSGAGGDGCACSGVPPVRKSSSCC